MHRSTRGNKSSPNNINVSRNQLNNARNEAKEKYQRRRTTASPHAMINRCWIFLCMCAILTFLLTSFLTSSSSKENHNAKFHDRDDVHRRSANPADKMMTMTLEQQEATTTTVAQKEWIENSLRGGGATTTPQLLTTKTTVTADDPPPPTPTQQPKIQEEQEPEQRILENDNVVLQQQQRPQLLVKETTQEARKSDPKGQKNTRLLLHVGPHKTATTTIQTGLRKHRYTLAEDNYFYVGKLDDEMDVFRPIFQACFPFDSDEYPCHEQTIWRNFVKKLQQHCDAGHNVILSSEEMSNYPQKDEHWDMLKNEAFACFDSVEIILTYRRYHEWMLSYYNNMFRPVQYNPYVKCWPGQFKEMQTLVTDIVERVEGVLIPTFEEYFEDPRKYEHLQNHDYFCGDDTKTFLHPLECTKRHYEAHFDNISIFNIHERTEKDGNNTLSNFVCNFLTGAMNACEVIRDTEDKNVTVRNEMMDLDAQLIADSAYRQGLIGSKYDSMTRIEFTQMVEDVYWDDGETSEVDIICPDSSLLKKLKKQSLKAEERLLPEFYASSQGKKDLKASFARYKEEKLYCTVDVESVLEGDSSDKWQFLKQQKQEVDLKNDAAPSA